MGVTLVFHSMNCVELLLHRLTQPVLSHELELRSVTSYLG